MFLGRKGKKTIWVLISILILIPISISISIFILNLIHNSGPITISILILFPNSELASNSASFFSFLKEEPKQSL